MRRTIPVLGAMMAVLMFAMVGARAALADTIIDTIPQANGTMCCLGVGGDSETYGQVITAPADDTQLDSFTFSISTNPIVLRGEVYAWDGEKATGPNLYESAPRTVTSTTGSRDVTFDTGGVQLVPGQQYVLFVTLSKDYESNPSSVSASFFGVHTGSGEYYPGGTHVRMDNGPSFDQLFTDPWNLQYFDWDLAFRAVFSSSDSPTTKEDCKKGGYAKYGFKNQGQCAKVINQATPADTTAPVVTFTTEPPSPSNRVLNFFEWTITDNVGVTEVQCSSTFTPANGSQSTTRAENCAGGNAGGRDYAVSEQDGTLVYKVTAKDAAGNTTVATSTIQVELIAAPTIVSPTSGSTVSSPIIFSGTGSQPGNLISIQGRNPSGSSFEGQQTTIASDGTWSLDVTPAAGEGTYQFWAYEHDSSGFRISEESGHITLTVDNAALHLAGQ